MWRSAAHSRRPIIAVAIGHRLPAPCRSWPTSWMELRSLPASRPTMARPIEYDDEGLLCRVAFHVVKQSRTIPDAIRVALRGTVQGPGFEHFGDKLSET